MTQLNHIKLMLIVAGVFFTSGVFGQTKTDAELYTIWKDKSKPESVRLEAIWEECISIPYSIKNPDGGRKGKRNSRKSLNSPYANNLFNDPVLLKNLNQYDVDVLVEATQCLF